MFIFTAATIYFLAFPPFVPLTRSDLHSASSAKAYSYSCLNQFERNRPNRTRFIEPRPTLYRKLLSEGQ